MTTFAIALLSVMMSVAAQFLLKAGLAVIALRGEPGAGWKVWALVSEPKILAGFALYGLGAVVWLSVLARWEVSKAYPLIGVGFLASVVVGWWLGEAVGVARIGGALLICAGVGLIARS